MKKFPVLGLVVFVFALVSASALALLTPQRALAECGGPFPPKPAKVWAKSGPGGGEVTLFWDEVAHANRYAVAYGQWSGKYTYGADNIGGTSSRSYTVKGLNPGTKYAFVLAAARDCASSPFSQEVWGTAAGGLASPTGGWVSKASSTGSTTWTPPAQPKAQSWTAPRVGSGPVGKQSLWAKSGPGVGQVTLYWKQADSANNYHLVYGTQPGKEQYGALNIGNTTWYTVKHLAAGTRYYFALVPTFNGRALYTTGWVSATAYMPVEVVEVLVPAVTMPPAAMESKPQTYVPEDTLGNEDIVYEEYVPDDSGVQGVSDETNQYYYEDENPEDAPAYIGSPQE